jgi:hypothetical protein
VLEPGLVQFLRGQRQRGEQLDGPGVVSVTAGQPVQPGMI